MEILPYNFVPCCRVDDFKCTFPDKTLNSSRKNDFACKRSDGAIAWIDLRSQFLRSSSLGCFGFRNYKSKRGFIVCESTKHNRIADFKVYSGSYNSYVIGEEEDERSISDEGEEAADKVLIPGLPDESNGECEAKISSCFWEWKPKLTVHYEKAGLENANSPPVLFLPGFGVGSFHYEKQLKDLGREYRVFALDFLGQGKSLPFEDPTPLLEQENKMQGKDRDHIWGFRRTCAPWARKLVYSIDLWQDQVQSFIEEVIGEPVYVVGNSLGGYVALYFAACNPQLVKGVTLLNATPFWGFLPNPVRYPRLARIFPWAGTFPLPAGVRKLTELAWQKISGSKSIEEILKQVYVDHSTNIDKLSSRIHETTQHPAAAAAFASIMFAPQGKLSFGESLSRCRMNNTPICLMYGKEDPWVKPVWGRQVKRQVPEAQYYEISPAGHCPHDEVPEVINHLLRGWIKNLESQGSAALPLHDDRENIHPNTMGEFEFVREGAKKSAIVRSVGTGSLLWGQINTYIKSAWRNQRENPET